MSSTESSQSAATSTIDQTLEHAIAYHQAGQLQDAELFYRTILAIQPDHPDANHNMGVLSVQLTQIAEGLRYFLAALKADPTPAQFWLSYIDALYQAGQLEDALQVLAHARHQGLQGDAVEVLSVRLDEATQAAEQPDAHVLGESVPVLSAASLVGRKLPKTKSASKSVTLKKKIPGVKKINALMKLFGEGRYLEIIDLAKKMTKHFPLYGFGWKALGTAFKQLEQSKLALAALQKAVALSPNDAESHNILGITLQGMGRLYEAEMCCRRAIQINPGLIEGYINLGVTLNSLGRSEEAEASYRRALKIDAAYSKAMHALGSLCVENGRIEEAVGLYQQALKSKPGDLKIRYSLALATQVSTGNANFTALLDTEKAALKGAIRLSKEDQVFLHFALGKCYDDVGDYELAFPHFLEGCKLKRATINFNPDSDVQKTSGIIQILDQATIDRLRGAGNPSQLPIFILGMPRSGSTLVEQIIASHPDVFGAGELSDLLIIAQQNNAGAASAFPDNLRSLDQATLTAWGTEYVSRLALRAPGSPHVTDKMPGNYLAIGLIHLMLPNAKIIHVKRNPVDTCLSCFTQLFTEGAQEYVYDLTELGQYYNDYSRVMDHWRNVLPAGAFLEVNYEDIVADPEPQARRMIEYCGLEWSDACLEFHQTKRRVRTASVVQVRQPIYNLSVGRWRHYDKFLTPLFDALGDFAPECM